jgi:hypothetical protein
MKKFYSFITETGESSVAYGDPENGAIKERLATFQRLEDAIELSRRLNAEVAGFVDTYENSREGA